MLGALLGIGIMTWAIMALVCFVAFIWAIIDIMRQKKETGWKLIWVLITLFLGIIGVFIYYFVSGRTKGK